MAIMNQHKRTVIVAGPAKSTGGVASVIDTILNQNMPNEYVLIRLNTSLYKNGGLLREIKTLSDAMIKYLFHLMFKDVDIIHLHVSANISFYRKSIFGLIGKMFGKKIIYHIHAARFYDFFCNPSNMFLEKYIQAILQSANAVVCLCQDWKANLVKKYRLTNVSIIRNPVAMAPILKERNSNQTVKLLFMGFLIESKGIMDLLEVCRGLAVRGINYELAICGKGELTRTINRFIQDHSLERHIKNMGWVQNAEKERIFEQTDILILPSYKEGMPIAILEAFSYGLSVVSTTISCIPEIVKDEINGFLVAPGDKHSLLERINELIDNKALRNKISRNNLAAARNYIPQVIAHQWASLYEEILCR